ncbi:hypothetical protein CEW46_27490 [Bacillus cereus]|nr:hypothetical protein CEW46_27490 [Bacillus cereus]
MNILIALVVVCIIIIAIQEVRLVIMSARNKRFQYATVEMITHMAAMTAANAYTIRKAGLEQEGKVGNIEDDETFKKFQKYTDEVYPS